MNSTYNARGEKLNSFFYIQADKNSKNSKLIDSLEAFSEKNCTQTYIINSPLVDKRYAYDYTDCLVILIPNQKIIFVDFSNNPDNFNEFCEDFIEDLGSLSDKYRYKDIIGRPRTWRQSLTYKIKYNADQYNINQLLTDTELRCSKDKKCCELLISLLTGSINDIDRVKDNIPNSILDKIKQKIILLDGDQSRFIYHKPSKKKVTIQGLSGTGKTELLLHKLKELYTENTTNKIFFTCHNKVLADSLKKRIPQFFNFMKVEEQIEWEERLWCSNAWGSRLKRNSGLYSYICDYYNIPFHQYDFHTSFEDVCAQAIKDIDQAESTPRPPIDYLLIDESQDFPHSFFDLCEKVCKNNIYIAGDIFQSIFDTNIINEIEPDYLLSKCYRTDPKTLMFAHSLGLGLFESPKLNWLKDKEWKACGYKIKKKDSSPSRYYLSREPLRRFEDLEAEGLNSVEVIATQTDPPPKTEELVINIIESIKKENPTVEPKDIGIIFIDGTKDTYLTSDKIEYLVSKTFKWPVNKAYESKSSDTESLFISNRNNVKGLEFPFVICIASKISKSHNYRNSLYMILTRSFIKTYLILPEKLNQDIIPSIKKGLDHILKKGEISVSKPTSDELESIRTTINYTDNSASIYDLATDIFQDLEIEIEYRDKLMKVVKTAAPDTFTYENIREIIELNYSYMSR